jgi:hypothetical protein
MLTQLNWGREEGREGVTSQAYTVCSVAPLPDSIFLGGDRGREKGRGKERADPQYLLPYSSEGLHMYVSQLMGKS